jgi:hypothetical protein
MEERPKTPSFDPMETKYCWQNIGEEPHEGQELDSEQSLVLEESSLEKSRSLKANKKLKKAI